MFRAALIARLVILHTSFSIFVTFILKAAVVTKPVILAHLF